MKYWSPTFEPWKTVQSKRGRRNIQNQFDQAAATCNCRHERGVTTGSLSIHHRDWWRIGTCALLPTENDYFPRRISRKKQTIPRVYHLLLQTLPRFTITLTSVSPSLSLSLSRSRSLWQHFRGKQQLRLRLKTEKQCMFVSKLEISWEMWQD